MSIARVRLEPLAPDDFPGYFEDLVRAYAADKVRAGLWPVERSEAMARENTLSLLTEGQATPGHSFFRAVEADQGQIVGNLWVAELEDEVGPYAYIYDIEILEAARGRGYGRALLEAFEALAASKGIRRLRLHVFAFNEVAQSLYRSAGWTTTGIWMGKDA